MKCDIKAARCIGNAFDLLLTRLASEHTKRVADKIPVFNLTSRIGDKKFCPNHKDTCDLTRNVVLWTEGSMGVVLWVLMLYAVRIIDTVAPT